MTSAELVTNEQAPERLTAVALTWPAQATALKIADPDSYRRGAEFLLGLKSLRKQADEIFNPPIEAAHASHKAALEAKRKVETPLAEAEQIIKRTMGAYDTEQRRLADLERRRLEEEARRAEETRVLELAAEMETESKARGDAEMLAEAHEMISAPIVAPPIAPVVKATPTVAGVSYRQVWKFAIDNPRLVPDAYKTVNESAIRSVVNGMKGATQIPGVRVWSENVIAAGR